MKITSFASVFKRVRKMAKPLTLEQKEGGLLLLPAGSVVADPTREKIKAMSLVPVTPLESPHHVCCLEVPSRSP